MGQSAASTAPCEPDPLPVSATEVITWLVEPGREAEFEDWAHGLTEAASRQRGHLGAAWLRPESPGGPYHVVVRFVSAELLERWMGSDERSSWLDRLDGIASAASGRQTGFETWFSIPERASTVPARWRMVAVTLLAIYPLSVLWSWLAAPHVRAWPLGVRALLFPLVLVPVLTYLVMPRLSRLLQGWLYAERRRRASRPGATAAARAEAAGAP